MKLRDYFVSQPMTHAYLESGQQYFEVGTRGIESIEANATGVCVTILPDSGVAARSLLFTGNGVGATLSEADEKRWADHFKALRAERIAEAKDRVNRPPPPETPMEVP